MWAIAMQQTDAFNQWEMGSTAGPSHPTFSPRNYQLGVVKLILLRARCRTVSPNHLRTKVEYGATLALD